MPQKRGCNGAVGVAWTRAPGGGGGGGWHKASVSDCLPLAAPIGLLPLLILTLCGPERVLVVSTEPPDDLSCLTTPGVGCPGDGLLPLTRCIQMHAPSPAGKGGGVRAGTSWPSPAKSTASIIPSCITQRMSSRTGAGGVLSGGGGGGAFEPPQNGVWGWKRGSPDLTHVLAQKTRLGLGHRAAPTETCCPPPPPDIYLEKISTSWGIVLTHIIFWCPPPPPTPPSP